MLCLILLLIYIYIRGYVSDYILIVGGVHNELTLGKKSLKIPNG